MHFSCKGLTCLKKLIINKKFSARFTVTICSLGYMEHMGERQLGVTVSLCQNRLCGLPLPTKEMSRKFERGHMHTIRTSQ